MLRSNHFHDLTLSDVVVCNELAANFVSMSKLAKKGFRSEFDDAGVKIYKGNILVLDGCLVNTDLYELNLIDEEHDDDDECELTKCLNNVVQKRTVQDKVFDWHVKLNHLSLEYMKKIQHKLDIEIPNNLRIECLVCTKAKMKRLPFNQKHQITDEKLKVIHTDLSGIIRINNREGYKYFLLFQDEATRMLFVYFLRSKTEVCEKFKEFKQMVELQTGKRIKYLMSDNGTEYQNQYFEELQLESGLTQQFSAARCPSSNGTSERSIQSTEVGARCMLLQSNLKDEFWVYAVRHSVYIKNRTPHSAIGFKIPYELFYDKLVDYGLMRTFGQKVVYLRDDEQLAKFDHTGEEGIFLGIPFGYKAYFVYSLPKNKVIIRRHVKFIDDKRSQINPDDNPDVYRTDQIGDCLYEVPNTFCVSERTEQVNDHAIGQFERTDENSEPIDLNENVETFDTDRPSEERETELDDYQSANEEMIGDETDDQSDEFSDDIRRPVSGEQIVLNRTQKRKLLDAFQDIELTRVAPVNKAGRGKFNSYRVNSIMLPRTLKQVKKSTEQDKWQEAMKHEIESMKSNNVWEEVDRPKSKQILPMNWVYKVKYNQDGTIDKYKARLVVLGNLQRNNKNDDVFSPVLNESSFKALLAYGVKNRMHIHHLDVCTAYLHAEIAEEIYVEKEPGHRGDLSKVYRLLKSMYGLRSSARTWYNKIKSILMGLGFKRSSWDTCVFQFRRGGGRIIIGLYVDDLLVMSNDEHMLNEFKRKLDRKITISDKDGVSNFLNMNINYDRVKGVMKIDQTEYINQLLENFNMVDCNIKKTPVPSGAMLYESVGEPLNDCTEYMSIVGRLIYLSVHTRPDISFIVSRLCQFMSNPTEYHLKLAKHVIRYLKYTKHYSLSYFSNQSDDMCIVHCDADYANDLADSKSINGITVQVFGCLVGWSTVKQSKVSLSTCESEIRSIVDGITEVKYVKSLLQELDNDLSVNCIIYNDNQSAVKTCKRGGNFAKNRHYRSKVHFVQDTVNEHWLTVEHKEGTNMIADFLTKALSASKLNKFLNCVNVI